MDAGCLILVIIKWILWIEKDSRQGGQGKWGEGRAVERDGGWRREEGRWMTDDGRRRATFQFEISDLRLAI